MWSYDSNDTFFWRSSSFSYHNFWIPSIKFLANCEIPLPFKCNPLLSRGLLFIFPFSIMSICKLRGCDWISTIFIERCFESALVIGWYIIATLTVFEQFPFLHNGQHHKFEHAISHGRVFYQVVIYVRASRTWDWPFFNQTFAWHFGLINTANHRLSNDNASSFWPGVFNSISVIFLSFSLLSFSFYLLSCQFFVVICSYL